MKKRLQVFVSSTYKDLIVERQAAVSAILKAGHIPAGMELFTAGDKSQMKIIEKWIDESDVYMLILGGRYGSIEPTSGVSYIELEYDYARNQSKPMFAVVINEQALEERVKNRGTEVLERENPKVLEQFRRKVLSNISSFFDDEKDIKLCIHESLADLSNNPTLKGWVSGDAVEDSGKLLEEIRQLREENDSLKLELKRTEVSAVRRSQTDSKASYDELVRVMQSIEVNVPEGLTSDKKASKMSLYSILINNADPLTRGVANRYNATDAESFLYHSVVPKLQVHGLAETERVAGTQYRRGALNKAGLAFVGEFERRKALQVANKSKPKNDGEVPKAEKNNVSK